MYKWIGNVLLSLLMMAVMPISFATNPNAMHDTNSPEGFWKTIDDVTGQPKAILQISKAPNDVLYGRILKTFPVNNKEPMDVCSKCSGDRHNQPLIGMVIMENLKQNGTNATEWSGGEILDPKSGKQYHCSLKVIDNGQKLNVRGYIGLPLFGRSQTWLRVPDPNA